MRNDICWVLKNEGWFLIGAVKISGKVSFFLGRFIFIFVDAFICRGNIYVSRGTVCIWSTTHAIARIYSCAHLVGKCKLSTLNMQFISGNFTQEKKEAMCDTYRAQSHTPFRKHTTSIVKTQKKKDIRHNTKPSKPHKKSARDVKNTSTKYAKNGRQKKIK